MNRARRSLRWRGELTFAALGLALAFARPASAQCVGARPTDPGGYANNEYGAAEVKSFATADVRVHYATSGTHAPDPATTRADGVPDTVAYAAQIGQESLSKYAEMGFRKIPSDASCASNGGDEKVDIYLVKFAGADGSTAPEACNGVVCSSFVLVDSTFKGRGYPSIQEGFRTVVAHELFHAVQNAYDKDLDRFWAEGTAQWAMKTLYPELVDFEHQLPAFFSDTKRSLDSQPGGVTAGFLYGSAVWPLYLTLAHGDTTVREILEAEAGGEKTIPATDAVLAKKGSSLAEAYPMFAAWNASTGKLTGTGGYPDAAKYPGVKVATLEDGVSGITSGLSSFAFSGTLEAPSKIALETDEARNGGVVVPLEGGKARVDLAAKLPANAEGEVLVVVAGTTTKKTDAPFTVRILPPDAPTGGDGGGGGGGGDDGCNAAGSSSPGSASLALATACVLGALGRRKRRA